MRQRDCIEIYYNILMIFNQSGYPINILTGITPLYDPYDPLDIIGFTSEARIDASNHEKFAFPLEQVARRLEAAYPNHLSAVVHVEARHYALVMYYTAAQITIQPQGQP